MAGLTTSVALLGGARQTARGTLAAGAAFGHGVASGAVARVEVEQERDDVTAGTRDYSHVNRLSAVAGFECETRAWPKSIGLWLFGALGTIVTTGAGPYSHVFTGADVLPYLSIFGKYGADVRTVRDCIIDELTLSWDGVAPLAVELSGVGTLFGFTGAYAPTVDESVARYLIPGGGTFKLAAVGAVPVTARVKAGSVGISNNVEPIILSGSVVPDDVHPGRRELTANLTVVPDNYDLWREVVTGTAGGATVSEVPIEGSFEVKFVDPTSPATAALTVIGTRVPFMTTLPDADPSGAAAEMELTGMPLLPAAGAAITATLVNSQATYPAS